MAAKCALARTRCRASSTNCSGWIFPAWTPAIISVAFMDTFLEISVLSLRRTQLTREGVINFGIKEHEDDVVNHVLGDAVLKLFSHGRNSDSGRKIGRASCMEGLLHPVAEDPVTYHWR